MKISEVEQQTGITKKNIRFYEDQGLLNPARNHSNGYRIYSEEDVRILKEIKLYRKLGIAIEEIRSIQEGSLSLDECMAARIVSIESQIKEMSHIKGICKKISDAGEQAFTLNSDEYLFAIESLEHKGIQFVDIAKDFLIKAKKLLPPSAVMYFEPEEPIMNKRDFTMELIHFCERNNYALTILKEGMEPIVEIDNKKYFCTLNFAGPRTMGYRTVRIFPCDDQDR